MSWDPWASWVPPRLAPFLEDSWWAVFLSSPPVLGRLFLCNGSDRRPRSRLLVGRDVHKAGAEMGQQLVSHQSHSGGGARQATQSHTGRVGDRLTRQGDGRQALP